MRTWAHLDSRRSGERRCGRGTRAWRGAWKPAAATLLGVGILGGFGVGLFLRGSWRAEGGARGGLAGGNVRGASASGMRLSGRRHRSFGLRCCSSLRAGSAQTRCAQTRAALIRPPLRCSPVPQRPDRRIPLAAVGTIIGCCPHPSPLPGGEGVRQVDRSPSPARTACRADRPTNTDPTKTPTQTPTPTHRPFDSIQAAVATTSPARSVVNANGGNPFRSRCPYAVRTSRRS